MSLSVQQLGSGPELTLLHGWGMNAAVWTSITPALAANFHLNLIELPGHGESDALPEADLDQWIDAVLEVAPVKSHYLGWSLGGLLSQAIALKAPERVDVVGLVGSTPSFVQRDGWRDAMPQSTFDQFANALADDAASTLKRFLGLQVKGLADARVILRDIEQALATRPAASDAGLQQGLAILLNTDLREHIHGLQGSHWLFGERDTLVPSGAADAVAQLCPSAQITTIAKSGHAPMLSHADEFLAWVLQTYG